MVDRRLNTRRKTFLGARLHYHQQSANGIVRNLSPLGARIVFQDVAVVHDEFDVELARLGQRLKAKVTWRKTHEFGVAFLEDEANVRPLDFEATTPGTSVQPCPSRQLAADLDRLRRRIAQVTSARS